MIKHRLLSLLALSQLLHTAGCAADAMDDEVIDEGADLVTQASTVTSLTSGSAYVIRPRGNDNSFISLHVHNGAWGQDVVQSSDAYHAGSQFRAYRNSDGSWTFKDVPTERCLDVSGAKTANGTPVIVFKCNGANNQRFTLAGVSGTTTEFTLAPKHAPSMRLDVGATGFHKLQIWQSNGSSAQRIRFDTPPTDKCIQTVESDTGERALTQARRCTEEFPEHPDTTSKDAGTAEAAGGWREGPALFTSQAVGIIAGGVVAGLMTQTPAAPYASKVGSCIYGGVSLGLYDRLTAGKFEPKQIAFGIVGCVLGVGGEVLLTKVKTIVANSVPVVQARLGTAFRAFWEPLLKTGPIEVMIFGDISADEAVAATAASFGALKKRPAKRVSLGQASPASVAPTPVPIVRTHKGPKEQAAAVLAWPLGGGLGSIYEARKLEILAQIFNDRMFTQLREEEGASYSPNVDSSWPTGLESGGSFIVTSQLKPEGFERFFAISRGIAADLAAHPVSADELARVINPLHESINRASSGNSFWLGQLTGATRDPRKITALQSLVTDYLKITPAELQQAASKWLVPEKSFQLEVRPE